MIRFLSIVLIVAACSRSNDRILQELETRSTARPDLDKVLDEPMRPLALVAQRDRETFAMLDGELPYVSGTINGRETALLLDTGSSAISLTGPAAAHAGVYVPARREVRIVTPGNESPHRMAALESLAIGSFHFGPGAAAIPRRESAHRARGGGIGWIHATVGNTVLAHFRVTFDFSRGEVTLEPHGKPPQTGMLLVDVTINGRAWPMLVDSGATRLTLEPWAAIELGKLDRERQSDFEKQVGATGSGRRKTVRLNKIAVAGRTFRNVRTYVINTFGELRFSGRKVAGLLGLRGFGKLVWTLDYATRDLEISG